MSDAPNAATSIGASLYERFRKAVLFEPGELRPLLISSVYFFCVLAAYYIVRPIREEMGIKVGRDGLQTLFTVVFFVMVAAVPVFGWVATRFRRGAVVPVVYGFFIVNLIAFWGAFNTAKSRNKESPMQQSSYGKDAMVVMELGRNSVGVDLWFDDATQGRPQKRANPGRWGAAPLGHPQKPLSYPSEFSHSPSWGEPLSCDSFQLAH